MAAQNVIEHAGFDGIEIHGMVGFLIDQFLKETLNDCTDKYSESPENRPCFALELAVTMSAAVGKERVWTQDDDNSPLK